MNVTGLKITSTTAFTRELWRDYSRSESRYIMIISGEEHILDETDMEDTVFYGKWEKGGLWASGPGTIRLTGSTNGRASSTPSALVDIPDGVPAVMALVRP